jgi:hypothetical protein
LGIEVFGDGTTFVNLFAIGFEFDIRVASTCGIEEANTKLLRSDTPTQICGYHEVLQGSYKPGRVKFKDFQGHISGNSKTKGLKRRR